MGYKRHPPTATRFGPVDGWLALLQRRRWRDDFVAAGEAALAHGKNGSDAHERENRELRAELEERNLVIGELTVANRILKKLTDRSS